MKTPKACRQCRESKRRCTRRGPGDPCDTCDQRRLHCDGHLNRQYHGCRRALVAKKPIIQERANEQTVHVGPPGDDEAPSLPKGTAVELVNHYLDKIHDRPHSLFHPAILRAQVQEGTVSDCVLFAICALGSRFSANPDTRQLETSLAMESKRLLQAGLEQISLENIQTFLLLALLDFGNGNSSSEILFFRKLTRLASVAPILSQLEFR